MVDQKKGENNKLNSFTWKNFKNKRENNKYVSNKCTNLYHEHKSIIENTPF